MADSKVVNLNVDEFKKEVLENNLPVLVDFWAPWCGPCQMMAPILDSLSSIMDGKIKIAKVDIENPANEVLAIAYQIQSIPNMKLFKDGKIVGEFIGTRSLEVMKDEIERIIK